MLYMSFVRYFWIVFSFVYSPFFSNSGLIRSRASFFPFFLVFLLVLVQEQKFFLSVQHVCVCIIICCCSCYCILSFLCESSFFNLYERISVVYMIFSLLSFSFFSFDYQNRVRYDYIDVFGYKFK